MNLCCQWRTPNAIWQQLFDNNAIVAPDVDTDEKSVGALGHLADRAHA